MRIRGEETEEETGIVITGQQNTEANLYYRTYLDASAENWTIDEHAGRYIKITAGTGASSVLYPILSNSATRLETTDLTNTDGTTVISIISIPEMKGALISDPGTLYNFSSGNPFSFSENNINITTSRLDFSNVLDQAQNVLIFEAKDRPEFAYCNFSQMVPVTDCTALVYFNRCNLNFRGYTYFSIANYTKVQTTGCIVTSSDNTGYYAYVENNARYTTAGCRVEKQLIGHSSDGSGSHYILTGNHYKDC